MRNHFSLVMAIVMIVAGCTKIDSNSESESDIQQINASNAEAISAYRSFAKILSSSLSSNEELREFIKATAIQQFDNDFDVFYPYVKDKEVKEGRSFKEYLLVHSSESELSHIEHVIPKLTVLVPDWSWAGCFTVNEWNTSSDEITVCYEDERGNAIVFADGEYLGTLPEHSLPDFPMLVLKSNERMVQLPYTRGGEPCFEFADEAFNGTITRVEHEISYPIIDGVPDQTSLVPANSLSQRVIDAYNNFPKGGSPQYQRDYIYWGLTKSISQGYSQNGIYEIIRKIRLNNWEATQFYDDYAENGKGDFSKETVLSTWTIKDNKITVNKDMLRDNFYSEGSLEIQVDGVIPYINGDKVSISKTLSVPFGKAFAIEKARLDFRHKTLFCKRLYVYDVYKSYLYSKWINVDLRLPRWDISEQSSLITLVFTEFDETGSSELSFQYSAQKSNSFNIDASVEGAVNKDVKIKSGLGYAYTNSNTHSESGKIIRNQGGIDRLGQIELDYVSPIFIDKVTKDGITYYEYDTSSTSTGLVDVMIIPVCY